MLRTDIGIFGTQLNAIAEVLGKPAVSVKAMEIWFDTLKEFPTEHVMDVLNNWLKRQGRFPTPAQVWDAVNENCIRERERRAAIERAQNFAPVRATEETTQYGHEYRARIRAILSSRKKPFVQHWLDIKANPNSSFSQRMFAEEALRNLGHREQSPVERVPGEDDEQLAA